MQDKVIPRAVSEEHFHSVCPEEETVVLPVGETANELCIDVDQGSALTTMTGVGEGTGFDGAILCGCSRETNFYVYVSLLIGSFWGTAYDGGSLFGTTTTSSKIFPIYEDWDWSAPIHWTLEANGIPPPSIV